MTEDPPPTPRAFVGLCVLPVRYTYVCSAKAEPVPETPWEETAKTIEEKFWEHVGGQAAA